MRSDLLNPKLAAEQRVNKDLKLLRKQRLKKTQCEAAKSELATLTSSQTMRR